MVDRRHSRLDEPTIVSMITRLARYPYVRDYLQAKYPSELAQARRAIDAAKYPSELTQARRAIDATPEQKIDFANIEDAVWQVLNAKMPQCTCHYEDGSSHHVSNEIAIIVKLLAEKVSKSALYYTKKLAMWTLHNIGRSVLLSPSELGSQVRRNFGRDDVLKNAMRSIVRSMSPKERLRLGRSHTLSRDPDFAQTLYKLALDARKHGIFRDLRDVALMIDEDTYDLYDDNSSGDDPDVQSGDDAGSDEDPDEQSGGNISSDESIDSYFEDASDSGEDQSRPRKRHRSA